VLNKVLDRVLYANVVRFALRLLSDMLLSTSVRLLGLTLRHTVLEAEWRIPVSQPADCPRSRMAHSCLPTRARADTCSAVLGLSCAVVGTHPSYPRGALNALHKAVLPP